MPMTNPRGPNHSGPTVVPSSPDGPRVLSPVSFITALFELRLDDSSVADSCFCLPINQNPIAPRARKISPALRANIREGTSRSLASISIDQASSPLTMTSEYLAFSGTTLVSSAGGSAYNINFLVERVFQLNNKAYICVSPIIFPNILLFYYFNNLCNLSSTPLYHLQDGVCSLQQTAQVAKMWARY